MTYSDKLKDPRWQRKRLEILSRDKFSCLWCGDDKSQLQVHHSYYVSRREPWEYPDWSLCTLCINCHETTRIKEFEPQCEGIINDLCVYSDKFHTPLELASEIANQIVLCKENNVPFIDILTALTNLNRCQPELSEKEF